MPNIKIKDDGNASGVVTSATFLEEDKEQIKKNTNGLEYDLLADDQEKNDHGLVGRRDSTTQIIEMIRVDISSFLSKLDLPVSIHEKLTSVLLSGIKGVRNRLDTGEVLSRAVEQNGFGLESSIVEAMLNFIEDQKKKFNDLHGALDRVVSFGGIGSMDEMSKNNIKKSDDSISESITIGDNSGKMDSKKQDGLEKLRRSYREDNYKPSLIKESNKKSFDENSISQTTTSLSDNTFNKQPVKKEFPKQTQKKLQDGVSKSSAVVSLAPPPNPLLIRRESSGVSMVDVVDPKVAMTGAFVDMKKQGTTIDTRGTRLIGPIDELRLLGLDEFKRLSPDVRVRVQKITEKFALLEERGYVERIRGVEAWRSSPLYSLYVAMGYEALFQEKDLKRVIDERYDKKTPFLSLDEFYAVSDINKSLMF